MTVKEAAKLYNVSRQTVYNTLGRAGKPREQLLDKDGELTEIGEEWLLLQYGGGVNDGSGAPDQQQPTTKEMREEVERLRKKLVSLQEQATDAQTATRAAEEQAQEQARAAADREKAIEAERDAYKQSSEVLQVKIEALTEQVKALTGERDYLRQQLDKLTSIALPAPAEKKPTFIQRIFGKKQ